MSIISLHIDQEEERIIRDYAKLNNMTISQLFRTSVLEKIEADIDLKLYNEALDEYHKSPDDISFDEMMKKLDKNESC